MKKYILFFLLTFVFAATASGAAFVVDGQSQDQFLVGAGNANAAIGVLVQDQGYQLGVDPDGQAGLAISTPGDTAASNQLQTQNIDDTFVATDADSAIIVDYDSTTSQLGHAETNGGLAAYTNQNVSGSLFFGANDSNGTNGIAGAANGFDHQTEVGVAGTGDAQSATQTIQHTDYLVASNGPNSAIAQFGTTETDVITESSIVNSGTDSDQTTAIQAGGSIATNNGQATSMQGVTAAIAVQQNTGGATGYMQQNHGYMQVASDGPFYQMQQANSYTIENF